MSAKQWWEDWRVELSLHEKKGLAKVEINLPNAEDAHADIAAPPGLGYFLNKVFTDAFTLIEKLHDEKRATTSLMFDVGKWNFKDRITAALGMIGGGKFIIDSAEVKIEKELKSATKEGKKYVG